MLTEIQVNLSRRKLYALDDNYEVMATLPVGTAFYPGENEYGQPRGNASPGVYNDGEVWAEIYGPESDEAAYGWAYINIDSRGRALHGGGSNLGEPDCYDPFQALLPTYGCFRMHNADVYWLAQQFEYATEQGCKPCIHIVE